MAKGQGFASLSPERRREVASKGGRAAHAKGTAHKWRSFEEASEAGKKGGKIGGRIGKRGPSKRNGA